MSQVSHVSQDSRDAVNIQFTIKGKKDEYMVTKEHLGGGAFGTVWKGIRVSDKKEVAIKMMAMISKGYSQRKAIASEISVLEKLSYFPKCFQYISCIYDYVQDEENMFIVMELVTGGLLNIVNRDIVIKLAKGLSHIHSHGIIHRDIKPVNVLIDSNGDPKIVDLGFGCTVTEIAGISNCNGIAGTPRYLDPLFTMLGVKNIRTATYKSDIFGLGQTLYKIIFDKEPHVFYKKAPLSVTWAYEAILKELEDKNTSSSGVDRLTLQLIGKMLNPLKSDQRPSAQDIINSYEKGEVIIEGLESSPAKPELNVVELVSAEAKRNFVIGDEEKKEYIDKAVLAVQRQDIKVPSNIKQLVSDKWKKELDTRILGLSDKHFWLL
jgi:serine/threonine protein kinase